jgi:hypothetical protein
MMRIGIRCAATGAAAAAFLAVFASPASADAGSAHCQEGFCDTPTINLLPTGSSSAATFADRVRMFLEGSEDGRAVIDETRNLLQENDSGRNK